MCKKKNCWECKHKDIAITGEYCWCGLENNKSKFNREGTEEGCKYFKRDYECVTAKGLWKYDFIGDTDYIYKQGKFNDVK